MFKDYTPGGMHKRFLQIWRFAVFVSSAYEASPGPTSRNSVVKTPTQPKLA